MTPSELHACYGTASIGYRLPEVRQLQNLAKPRLREPEDPVVRLPAFSVWLCRRRRP